nr:glycosyltransferase [Aminivibrio sp.]
QGSLEVYGNGWENHEKFGPYWRGFVPYERLPEIYSRARIVVDDAVEGITKPWGSVNSRVFDALAAGALVVTNGVKGSDDLFEGRLPGYADGEQLRKLIRTYGENEPEREKKAAELREMVLAGHTYRKRARELREILVRYCEKNYRIALKVPVPDRKQAHTWGDYHFALSLKRALVKQGHSVRIDLLPEWERREDFGDDVVLVLRGLSRYEPKRDHINLMWNISHADKVSFEEYEKYDHVFVASARFAEELKTQVRTPVTPLFQCTDPERFYRDRDPSTEAHDILFVGNSRKQNRPIISDALAGGLPVAVYGADWDGIIDEKHLLGKHIENENLRKYYSSCGIILNDHWPFMRDNGFISNRIFDAGACGACIVSDAAAGLEDLFGDAVSIYRTPEELKQIVEGLLADPGERKRKGEKLETLVRNGHRFSDRAETLLKIIDHLNEGRKDRLPIKKEVFGLLGENGGTEAIAVSESAGSADKAFPLAASIQKA